jgi:hypothetical protein
MSPEWYYAVLAGLLTAFLVAARAAFFRLAQRFRDASAMFLRPSGLRTRFFLVAFFVAAAGLTGAAEEGETIASIPRRAVTEAMALSMVTFQFSSRSIMVSRSVIRLQCSTDVESGVLSRRRESVFALLWCVGPLLQIECVRVADSGRE